MLNFVELYHYHPMTRLSMQIVFSRILISTLLRVFAVFTILIFVQTNPLFGQSRSVTYSERTDPHSHLVDFSRTNNITRIRLNYIFNNVNVDDVFCLSKETYLFDNVNGIKYKLLNTIQDGVCPYTIKYGSIGDTFSIILEFEALPQYLKQVDLIEGDNDKGINFYKIVLPPIQIEERDNPTKNYIDCNTITVIPGSNKPSFEAMLRGVRIAKILTPENQIWLDVFFLNALKDYLNEMGFETIELVYGFENIPKYACEAVYIMPDYTYDKLANTCSDIKLKFYHPIGEQWEFSSQKKVLLKTSAQPREKFIQLFKEMYGNRKPRFNLASRLYLPKRLTCFTEQYSRNYFEEKGIQRYEGLYKVIVNIYDLEFPPLTIAVKIINGEYYMIYLDGRDNDGDWSPGEVTGILKPTSSPGLFLCEWIDDFKELNKEFFVSFSENELRLTYLNDLIAGFTKFYPTVDNQDAYINPPNSIVSGTGWALLSEGYIVTNNHVIENAKEIRVKGINGDFRNGLLANLIVTDVKNDIAILRITDSSFKSLGVIPYTIGNQNLEPGNSVFVLSYPMRSTMGDEIKITNGIISSNTGFKGDITSYQVTVPVQPGSSGAPIFSSKGEVIGIITSKLTNAENASYAIKIPYLMSLIAASNIHYKANISNSLSNMNLPSQVKMIKQFIYIIEVTQ